MADSDTYQPLFIADTSEYTMKPQVSVPSHYLHWHIALKALKIDAAQTMLPYTFSLPFSLQSEPRSLANPITYTNKTSKAHSCMRNYLLNPSIRGSALPRRWKIRLLLRFREVCLSHDRNE